MTVAYAFVFGLAFGSFVNAAVDRIPRGHSLNGRSCCDACGRSLSAVELIPIVSYIALKGRCLGCHASIGVRSPAVEGVCGLAFAAAFAALAAPQAVLACVAFVGVAILAGVVIEKRGVRS